MDASISRVGYHTVNWTRYTVKKQAAPTAQQPSQIDADNAKINLSNSLFYLDSAILTYESHPCNSTLNAITNARKEAEFRLEQAKALGVVSCNYRFDSVRNGIIDLVDRNNQVLIGDYLISKDRLGILVIMDAKTGEIVNKNIEQVLEEELGAIQMNENLACVAYVIGVLDALYDKEVEGKTIDLLDLYYRSFTRDNAEDPRPKASAKELITDEHIDQSDLAYKELTGERLEDLSQNLGTAIEVYRRNPTPANQKGLQQVLEQLKAIQRLANAVHAEYDSIKIAILCGHAQGALLHSNQ